MIGEEVLKRTGIDLRGNASSSCTRIVLFTEDADSKLPEEFHLGNKKLPKPGAEGYCIFGREGSGRTEIFIAGKDERGLLYGVGRLLRMMRMKAGYVSIPKMPFLSTTPRFPIRGHQLGYRPKTNAYDAWTKDQFAHYIRDLAIFGANAIEILPPRTDDDSSGPLMKTPSEEMMVYLSEVIDSYLMDVWIWYPNMGKDYRDPACLKEEIEERDTLFSKLKRVDHVFIPGGDPGYLDPETLFSWAEQVANVLRRHHPNAKVWLSPQVFRSPEWWLNGFLERASKNPPWLGGIVFGPWEILSLPELRRRLPREIPIRRYPDITHSYVCQYPVPNWDIAFALTHGREGINPRPLAEKHIHNLFCEYAHGSVSYSEGINDDVNKFVWSDQDWDPDTPVEDTLRDYVRLFISPDHDDEIAQAILSLEQNWVGPLASNDTVLRTLRRFQCIEAAMDRQAKSSYRFKLAFIRAYYDAYIQERLIRERSIERDVYASIDACDRVGSLQAIKQALEIIDAIPHRLPRLEYRDRCWELSDELFSLIGAQHSVERHKAIAWNRGAFMDAIDIPLTDAPYLKAKLKEILRFDTESERVKMLHDLLLRADPGPGGFYDSFGEPEALKRIRSAVSWKEDPGYLRSPLISFATPLLYRNERTDQKGLTEAEAREIGPVPLAWVGNVTALYDTPIMMQYEGLDPEGAYRLRVTYNGVIYIRNFGPVRIMLTANESYRIHDYIDVTRTVKILEFDIPIELTAHRSLVLKWESPEGDQGPNIAEVWLMKKSQVGEGGRL